ncbi:MAG TPA: helix-hairpin-helix domain-containing protein [Candidatus Pacearchaeota archaeon]|nr:helix-hairpin-helix domain-containing protein [Candidatus Pacearchaeota archaeon]
MKKKFLFFIVFFIFSIINFSLISASCQKNQININTASLEELDKLAGIGPVKAQAIINSRPFNKLDDLLNVVGIGDVTLSNIKQQGLACVSGEEEEEEEQEDNEEEDEEKEDKKETIKQIKKISINPEENKIQEEQEIKPIILSPISPKSIKTEPYKKELDKNKFAIYGLVFLGILVFFLFKMKKQKNEKTEFK